MGPADELKIRTLETNNCIYFLVTFHTTFFLAHSFPRLRVPITTIILSCIVLYFKLFLYHEVHVNILQGVAAFFKELDSHPYLGHEGKNEVVSSNRREFLCKILRHSVQSLPDRETVLGPGDSISIDKVSFVPRSNHSRFHGETTIKSFYSQHLI